jgi:hypothetical protein
MKADLLYIIESAVKETLRRNIFDGIASTTEAFINLRSEEKLTPQELGRVRKYINVYVNEMLHLVVSQTRLSLETKGEVNG